MVHAATAFDARAATPPPWANARPDEDRRRLSDLRVALRYPEARLAENRAMAQAGQRLRYRGRVPARFSLATRYFLQARGVGHLAYYAGPAAQVRHQLLNQQWRLEHVDDDHAGGPQVSVSPDFSTIRAVAFDPPVQWGDDHEPRSLPILHDPEQVRALRVPDPESGLAGRRIEWYHAMRALAAEVEVTYNGRPVTVRVGLGSGEGGPFATALALAGERLYYWVYEAPDALHALMDLATETYIQQERYFRRLTGAPLTGCGMGCDGAELLSPQHFATFVLPYYERVYNTFPGGRRGFHMCGKIDHLLGLLARELQIGALNGFGDCLDRRKLAATLGGRALLSGGLQIDTLLHGPPEAIAADCRDALEILAPCGGYTLQDGNNVAPGTPPAHLAVVRETAERFGVPAGKEDTDS